MSFVKLETIGDGSCFFHAILQAFNKTYIDSSDSEKKKMTQQFRKDLSNVLRDDNIYEQLSRGSLQEFSKEYPPASLENMERDLRGRVWGDQRFLELVSTVLEIDIYIFYNKIGNLYNTGDHELYYKNRDSVVIINNNNFHFETIGLKSENGIQTFFDKDDPIIKNLHSKMYKGQV